MIDKFSNREKKGYTLIEMLVAVGIIIVICAIAIPAVASLKKSLEITKYDDVARQIYLVSQNKLTTMKASGTLNAFFEKVEKDYTTRKLGDKGFEPQDYDGDTDDWKKLYYFSNEDDIFINYIIGKDSILNASLENGGHYLVELNPETGDVYGVFYSEKAFTYDDVTALPSRKKSDRKETMIGYYGGISELSPVAGLPTEFSPVVTVVNKEDLYLNIECAGMRKLIKDQKNILLTVTLTDESFDSAVPSEHAVIIELKAGTDFVIGNDKAKIQILLDSIRGGNESFEKITKNKLTPGENIVATVSMTYSSDKATITGSASAQTNSLFAGKDENANLSVAYVRHLNNLREGINKVVNNGNLTINQTASIDYDYNNWEKDAVISVHAGENPFSGNFKPIKNDKLFKQSGPNTTTFNGNENKLQNFIISDGNYAGFFGDVRNTAFENMRLVNFNVSGGGYVGALAGSIANGRINNCGVYLETRDKNGLQYSDMNERVEKYKVSGTTSSGTNAYVGGLVGKIKDTQTSNSFAAINVSGNSTVAMNQSVPPCVGGFSGSFSGGSVTECYSSGDVTANQYYAGGFAGQTAGSTVSQSYSTSDVTAPSNAGGFVGIVSNGTITNCNAYGRTQRSDGKIDTATSGGFIGSGGLTTSFSNCNFLKQPSHNYEYADKFSLGKGYPDLKASDSSGRTSYPYSNEVAGKFPFSEQWSIAHYGDWPTEFKMMTSLVYYEKYTDGGYGFYAKTSLAADGAAADTEGINNWELDTLRQEPCIEDGYAIMTTYALTKFTYTLNKDLNSSAPTLEVNISDTLNAGTAKKIADNISLQFSNNKGAHYTISNAKLFRLPFVLQMTDRDKTARFYDRLVISGYINERVIFSDYTFFYCPDFAKDAINPDPSQTGAVRPNDPTGELNYISVRSPRQLNGLGRASYYWNTSNHQGSMNAQFYFKQENDIDFAAYTKTYCGVRYDLMDTEPENLYRNMPIGRPQGQTFYDYQGKPYQPSNFKHNYDGQGYKIIDYRCVTRQSEDYQFTGLFGETEMSELKNIVMIASDPVNESGYVRSEYNGIRHPGVGALAGLVFVRSPGDYNAGYSKVINCTVSGYKVSYEPGGNANNPFAVGGLVGYNFGKIENSSAYSKLVKANTYSANKAGYIGGLVGSINGRGSITNCYSGGVVDVDKTSSSTYLAGICAGFDNIYGVYDGQQSSRNMPITNVYTYCDWKNKDVRPYAVINKQDGMKLFYGYYLTNTVTSGVNLNGTSSGSNFSVTALNYSGLSNLSFEANGTARASGRASEKNTYPWRVELRGSSYPFPALVQSEGGTSAYVHYGNWPDAPVKGSGKVGAIKLYSKSSWHRTDYYANGVVVNLEDNKLTGYDAPWDASSDSRYGIIFDSAFAEDLSNWEAKYTYSYYYYDWPNSGWRWSEKTINLSPNTEGNLKNSNADGLTVNFFRVSNGNYLEEVILTNKIDGTEYVFYYNSNTNTFTY